MQAFICDAFRDLRKFGMAIAARRPIIATTIMISTSVNPLFLISPHLLSEGFYCSP